MAVVEISRQVARRYLLGQQGLWPGRRWVGKAGAATALITLGAVQMDPVMIVARSHDLVLWSRVANYSPAQLAQLLYQDRSFFDYGGHLDIYPITELPYWRLHMQRRRNDPKQAAFAADNVALLDAVRAAVRDRGPIANRDLRGTRQGQSYRGRTATSVALYHLWLIGELMTDHRVGFERHYDLFERLAPPHLQYAASECATEQFFRDQKVAQGNLFTVSEFANSLAYRLHRRVDRATARQDLSALLAAGQIVEVKIADLREPYYLATSALPTLLTLVDGNLPVPWQPCGSTTEEEVIFLSPLDNLLERKRTEALFDFTYLWEIYKPAAKRRWGAYTLPILYGDQLVARIDLQLDRQTHTLITHGFWLQEPTQPDQQFAAALARGLIAFAQFHQAETIDLNTLQPATLRRALQGLIAL